MKKRLGTYVVLDSLNYIIFLVGYWKKKNLITCFVT